MRKMMLELTRVGVAEMLMDSLLGLFKLVQKLYHAGLVSLNRAVDTYDFFLRTWSWPTKSRQCSAADNEMHRAHCDKSMKFGRHRHFAMLKKMRVGPILKIVPIPYF